MMRRLAILFVLLLCSAALHAQGLTPEDYYKLQTISQVAPSPTGDAVAYVVTSIDEEAGKRHREIWLIRLENGELLGDPYRFSSPAHSSSGPRWSPDGSLLSFISKRGEDENTVWFMRMDGSAGEPFHIAGVDAAPVWSPDGNWIAMVKRPETEEEPGPRHGWISTDAISTTLDDERFDGRVITHYPYIVNGMPAILPHPDSQQPAQLWIVPAEGGEAKLLTHQPFSVGNPVWSADSSRIYFSGDPYEHETLKQDQTANIYMVPARGGEVEMITPMDDGEQGQVIAPDGSALAWIESGSYGEQQDIYVASLASDGTLAEEPRNLTAEWDYSPNYLIWAGDGTLYFNAFFHGSSHLFSIDPADGNMETTLGGQAWHGNFSFTNNGEMLVHTTGSPYEPGELRLTDWQTGDSIELANHNSWLNGRDMNFPERITWTAPDGLEIEGWVLKPVGFDPEKEYPMVMKVHGGPHWLYGNYFFNTFHILSNSGFFVFYPNPRGSGSYGHHFMMAAIGGWGIEDEQDYVSGVEAVLKKYPQIDPERIGVSGGSYGGHISNWLTARTDLFAASVTSRSVARMENLWGTADIAPWVEFEMGGTPWEVPERYRQSSPFTYVEGVTAPTLIIHSEADYRTPVSDGELWYFALLRQNVPVEFVRYPRSDHNLSRTGEPWLLVDRLERLRSWMVHWLITVPAEEEAQ